MQKQAFYAHKKESSCAKPVFSTRKIPDSAEINDIVTYDKKDLPNVKVLVAWPHEIEGLLGRTKNLRFIQTFSAGVDGLPFEKLSPNIKIFSNVGSYTVPVAEHAWALALSLAKGINKQHKSKNKILSNKILMILGCGAIGSEIARIGKNAFRMHTIGLSRSFRDKTSFDETYHINRLHQLLPYADVVMIALPLTKYTDGLIDKRLLNVMKRDAILVNIGRAGIVLEKDITAFLRSNDSFRFGTDVFWTKKGKQVFKSKLWSFDNFLGTKHTAAFAEDYETIRNAVISAAKNVRLIMAGKGKNAVNLMEYKR